MFLYYRALLAKDKRENDYYTTKLFMKFRNDGTYFNL